MMRTLRLIALTSGLVLGLLTTVPAIAEDPAVLEASPEQIEFFEEQVRPLLVKRCYECHGGTRARGGLSLKDAKGWKQGGDSGPAIIPGKLEESLLIEAINYRSYEMPPADEGGQLPEDEIAILTQWVAMGAPDPRDGLESLGGMRREEAESWWAFQPLPEADVAAETDSGAIDQYLRQELELTGLEVGPAADKRTLLRRATYDLTGLPPTHDEVAAFLADDDPDAFVNVVDRLLESPQYGVHWGRHWLDVVRYADTAGENTDRPLPHAWRYRNWVFDAFNRDLPFDRFVRLQLAGDILAAQDAGVRRTEAIIATGYLAIARRFGHDIDKDMYLTYEDVIDNLGKNFLGLSLGCARCHDHKYDPVPAEDYYALYGIFESTKFAFPGCEPQGQPRDMVPLIEPAQAEALTAEYQRELAELEARAQFAASETQRLGQLASESVQLLAEASVAEGQSASIRSGPEGTFDHVDLHQGEVIQLAILPNGNYGADTTRIELQITLQDDVASRSWSPEDLIDRFTHAGPVIEQDGASWCLLDVTEGPCFLRDKKLSVADNPALSGWANGELPSSVVNASEEPLEVWTTLPPRAFFVHPGQDRNVAVAWVCPQDGTYRVQGKVTDAHPASGLDGVSFRLEHVASAEFGTGLLALGDIQSCDSHSPPEPPAIPVAYAVVDATPHNTYLQQRGDPEQLGEEIPRRWLSVFGGEEVPADAGSGRGQLADWVAMHPLSARVMVNRIWAWHFGRGIVASCNDFGARGEAPTHPELLEWLTTRFVASGYSVKSMHRLIMGSAAYQRASAAPQSADPGNRLLAHFSRRRLSAEAIRDSLLAASGQLDLAAAEAHPFPATETWNFTQHTPFTAVYETNKRSAYLMVQRQRRHPFLSLFDGADPNSSTPTRETTTVPTQALYFINDPFFHEQAASLAGSIMKLEDKDSRTTFAYQRTFQRDPTEVERAQVESFLASYPGNSEDQWSAFARVLLASNEFLYVD